MKLSFSEKYKDNGENSHISKSSVILDNAGGSECMAFLKHGEAFIDSIYLQLVNGASSQKYFDEHYENLLLDKMRNLQHYFKNLTEFDLPYYENEKKITVNIKDYKELENGLKKIKEYLHKFEVTVENMKQTPVLIAKIKYYILLWSDVYKVLTSQLYILLKTAKKGFSHKIWIDNK